MNARDCSIETLISLVRRGDNDALVALGEVLHEYLRLCVREVRRGWRCPRALMWCIRRELSHLAPEPVLLAATDELALVNEIADRIVTLTLGNMFGAQPSNQALLDTIVD